jgi:hypothetical protein
MAGIACTYLGCGKPAVKRLSQSVGGRPWHGCPDHYPAMVDALHIGMPGATSGGSWVEIEDLPAVSR